MNAIIVGHYYDRYIIHAWYIITYQQAIIINCKNKTTNAIGF